MVAEEIGLNDYLEANGIEPVETDLGEYIIQLRHEMPSHIIAPAVHLTKAQIEDDFRRVHTHLPPDRNLVEPTSLLAEARAVLREKFLAADVGITGANFLVAETGTLGDRHQRGQRRSHPDLAQGRTSCSPRSKSSCRRSKTSPNSCACWRARRPGRKCRSIRRSRPARAAEAIPTGRSEYHVVLLDNGRSAMLAGEFRDMLRCIRCGACMNHCPVYHAVGGHAYGWVYPGPMGAVLTPSLIGIDKAGHLPNASTFCGRCEEVCPVRIPLPRMMRAWREREFERHLSPATVRGGLAVWAFFASARALRHRSPPWRRASWDSPGAARPVPMAAARLRLDPLSRFPGAAGRNLPGAVETARARCDRCDRRTARIAAVNSRSLILATIRRSLGVTGTEAPRRFEVAARLAGHPAGVVPARGRLPAAARLDLFARMVVGAAGSAERVDNPAAIPAAVAAFLRGHNLAAPTCGTGDDPRLAALAWGTCARGQPRRVRRQRSRRGVSCLRGGRRNRHGRADLGRRQSDHA